MGMTTPAVSPLVSRIRRTVSIRAVLALYFVELFECGEDVGRMQCKCPIPSHPKKTGGKKTFRIYGDDRGHFKGWRCFSTTCGTGGGDVVEFVARMESCDSETAARKLAEWFEVKVPKPKE